MLKGGAESVLQQCRRCTHARFLTIPWRGQGVRRYTVAETSGSKVLAQSPLHGHDFLETSSQAPSALQSQASGSRPNVWSKMQLSPKRQCILTRQTLPADYLIKLKARYYPPSPTEGPGTGGNYLVPALLDDQPGRSWYLTLHPDFVHRLHTPGPHSGVLHQNNLSIPRKMDQWIQYQLAERIVKELQQLVERSRAKTPRIKNMAILPVDGGVGEVTFTPEEVQETSGAEESADTDRLVIRLPQVAKSGSDADPITSEGDVATVDLSTFPSSLRPSLFEAVEQLRLIERKYTLRQAILTKADLSAPHLRHLIGRRDPVRGEEEAVLVLSSSTERGQLSIPVMTALLRWKLYTGQGWEHEHEQTLDL